MPTRPFNTVLIANRGEIALRIMRTARAMGLRTVAVYSAADRDALHVRAVDSAIEIGAAAPSASYLNIAALLDAARRSGADAIHPGYGFLAENADFAQAVVDAGLVFVGPSAQAIRTMSHKSGAKQRLADAGVPVVPGYAGADRSDRRLADEASRLGFPVMIKAAAGGGGRGMRLVRDAESFLPALSSAQSEAAHAFGSDEILLEKAIVEPRHVEIQVFADAHGNVVHLGERDCSIQRRHQKLIEESPSPAVTPALRERMGAVSVAAARAIDYRGAGTLEFLLDAAGAFYFMEMNTRLQVEHAVTEAVVDVDLVEWQLRIARGEPLTLGQAEIDRRLELGGHAIEVRLCAEDAQHGFLPQCGTVALWRAPAGVRTDHALFDGCEVTPFYDSMLGKIVAHGVNRDAAVRKLIRALDDCVLLGLTSNRRFLWRCLTDPDFDAGRATTAFVDRLLAAEAPAAHESPARMVATVLILRERMRRRGVRYPAELCGWSSAGVYPASCRYELDGLPCEGRASILEANRFELEVDDARVAIRVEAVGQHELLLHLGDGTHWVRHASMAGRTYFLWRGDEYCAFDRSDTRAAREESSVRDGRIAAPINGRVVAFAVQTGQTVRSGQVLVVIEAMKMEHSIVCPHDGQVSGVYAQIGDQVAPGRLLAQVDPGGPAQRSQAPTRPE